MGTPQIVPTKTPVNPVVIMPGFDPDKVSIKPLPRHTDEISMRGIRRRRA